MTDAAISTPSTTSVSSLLFIFFFTKLGFLNFLIYFHAGGLITCQKYEIVLLHLMQLKSCLLSFWSQKLRINGLVTTLLLL